MDVPISIRPNSLAYPNPDKPEPNKKELITKVRKYESLNVILFRAFNISCIAAFALRRGVIVF